VRERGKFAIRNGGEKVRKKEEKHSITMMEGNSLAEFRGKGEEKNRVLP